MSARFSFLEFFAGGGMARAGLGDSWRCLLANDIDPQKCAAYRGNFGGDDLVEGDIHSLAADDMPTERTDLMWGSFPCQDLSLAGSRAGMSAARSGAFFGFWKLFDGLCARNRAPRLIAIENVTGLLSSNNGEDFRKIAGLIAGAGYRPAALIVDAVKFVPQSRPRLFIIGYSPDVAPHSAPLGYATAHPSIVGAFRKLSPQLQSQWIWPAAAPCRKSNTRLADIVEENAECWDTHEKTVSLLAMMAPAQRERIDALIAGRATRIGAGFRRTRRENGKSIQRFEARFDGVAGCLRTPAGGSSRQIIVSVCDGVVRTRLITPREAARLMGLGDDYILPASTTAALKLCGDGVCAPVVQWLAETIFEPALAGRQLRAAS